ncbi:MAG: small basic protein [Planctomycetota bacterium]
MSTDKSLKSRSTLARHRNVLSRDERIDVMKDAGTWDEGRSPLGLPKIAHRKVAVGKKEKAEKVAAEGAAAAVGAAPAEGAAAKPAAGAKPAGGKTAK